MAVTIVKELDQYTGDACLVETGGKHFVVSSTVAMFTGFETLIFPADEEGNVVDWYEVAGGRGVSREQAIFELDCMMGDLVESTATEVPMKELERGD